MRLARSTAAVLAVAVLFALLPTAPTQSQETLDEVVARSMDVTVDIDPIPAPPIDWNVIEDFLTGNLVWPTGTLRGRTVMGIEVTAPYPVSVVRLFFDSDVTLNSVQAEGTEVQWSRTADTLTVRFARALAPGAKATLTFDYGGKAYTLWNEISLVFDGTWYPELISPFGDTNANRAPLTASIGAPAGLTVASVGTLLGVTQTGNRRTWRFRSDGEIPWSAIVAGPFQRRDRTAAGRPVEIYTTPRYDRFVDKIADFTGKAIEWESQNVGALPSRNFRVVAVPFGRGLLGIGFPALMLITEDAFTGRLGELQRDSFLFLLLAHELAHSYIPSELGVRGVAFIWLSEGFAEYTSLRATEGVMGQKAFETELQDERDCYSRVIGRDRAIGQYTFSNYGGVGINVIYCKGALVHHMLRYLMGDVKYAEFIRAYITEFRGKSVRVDNMRETAERTYGQALDWFFSEWIDQVVVPDYQIAQASSVPDGANWKATATLRNTGTGTMPVDVAFVQDNGERVVQRVTVGPKEDKVLTVATPRPVTRVIADPQKWIIQSNYKNDELTLPR